MELSFVAMKHALDGHGRIINIKITVKYHTPWFMGNKLIDKGNSQVIDVTPFHPLFFNGSQDKTVGHILSRLLLL